MNKLKLISVMAVLASCSSPQYRTITTTVSICPTGYSYDLSDRLCHYQHSTVKHQTAYLKPLPTRVGRVAKGRARKPVIKASDCVKLLNLCGVGQ